MWPADQPYIAHVSQVRGKDISRKAWRRQYWPQDPSCVTRGIVLVHSDGPKRLRCVVWKAIGCEQTRRWSFCTRYRAQNQEDGDQGSCKALSRSSKREKVSYLRWSRSGQGLVCRMEDPLDPLSVSMLHPPSRRWDGGQDEAVQTKSTLLSLGISAWDATSEVCWSTGCISMCQHHTEGVLVVEVPAETG